MSAFEIAVGATSAFFIVVALARLKTGSLNETGLILFLASFFGAVWFIARLMGAA